jgi:hypothetical protein
MTLLTMQGTDARLTALCMTLRLLHPGDASLSRGIDRLIEQPEIAYLFDGVELQVVSFTAGDEGMYYITDGVSCTCKGARHRWCKHRILFRALLAESALIDPAGLRTAIAAQLEPLEGPDTWEDEATPVVYNDWAAGAQRPTPPATVTPRCADRDGCMARPYRERCRACRLASSEGGDYDPKTLWALRRIGQIA